MNEVKALARGILLGSKLNWGPFFLSIEDFGPCRSHCLVSASQGNFRVKVTLFLRISTRSRFLVPDARLVRGKILPPIASILSPRCEPDHRRAESCIVKRVSMDASSLAKYFLNK